MTSCFLNRCCGKKAYSKKQPEHSTVLRRMGMPPPARVNMPGYDKAKKKGERCEETAEEGGRAAGAMREMRIRVVSHRHRRMTKKTKTKS